MSEEIKGEVLKTKTSAKDISKWSMIIAGVWISVLSIIKGVFPESFNLTIDEIIKTGITLAALFSPVYLSIMLDKIKDIKGVNYES